MNIETLDTYVQATYPTCVKQLILHNKTLWIMCYKTQDGDGNISDWMLSAIELFKAGKYKEARTMIVSPGQDLKSMKKCTSLCTGTYNFGVIQNKSKTQAIVINSEMVLLKVWQWQIQR